MHQHIETLRIASAASAGFLVGAVLVGRVAAGWWPWQRGE